MLILNKKHKPLRKTAKMKRNEKGFGIVELLVIIVVIGLIGAVGWLVYDRQKSKQNNAETTQQSSGDQIVAKNDTKQEVDTLINPGWKRYTSERLKISFEYPSDWYVKEQKSENPAVAPDYSISISNQEGEINKGNLFAGAQSYSIEPLDDDDSRSWATKNEESLKKNCPHDCLYSGPSLVNKYTVANQNGAQIRVYDYKIGDKPEELDAYWTDSQGQKWQASNWRDRGIDAKTSILKQILPTVKNL